MKTYSERVDLLSTVSVEWNGEHLFAHKGEVSALSAEADAQIAALQAECAAFYQAAGDAQVERDAAREERDALQAECDALRADAEPSADWFDALIDDVSCLECRYRGDPSHDHDAYDMRERVVAMLTKRRDLAAAIDNERSKA